MSKKNKIWLMLASIFVLAGAALFVIGMSKNNWNFRNLGANNFETNNYEIIENFDNIVINTSTADIDFQYSTDGKCRVLCYENTKEKHYVSVENNVLNINRVNEKKWYDYIEFFSKNPKITVYLPNLENINLAIEISTGDVEIASDFTFESITITGTTSDVKCFASSTKQTKISVTTGDICIENTSAENYDLSADTGEIKLNNVDCLGEIKLKVSTGKNYLTNVNCGGIVSEGSTGDIKLNNVKSAGCISIDRDTGDVKFDRCDALELLIHTSTGDVEGTLLSDKVFIVRTDTGHIDVPRTITGGRCEITTSTGDIEFRIVNL